MERYRISDEAAVYFVTFSGVKWLPVFVSETACRIVTDSLTFCHRNKGLRTNAFVIMPTHIHAIIFHETFRSAPLTESHGASQAHRSLACGPLQYAWAGMLSSGSGGQCR